MPTKATAHAANPSSSSITTQAQSSVFQREVDKQPNNPLQVPIWQPGNPAIAGTTAPPPANVGHNFAHVPVLPAARLHAQAKFNIVKPKHKNTQAIYRTAETKAPALNLSNRLFIQRETAAEPRPEDQEALLAETYTSTGGEPIPDNGEGINSIGDAPASDPQSQGEVNPEQDEEAIQRKTSARSFQGPVIQPAAVATSLGRGQQFNTDIRTPYENFFGHDLSHVRIHTDNRATRWTHALGAQAFTVGNQIAFKSGYYSPHTSKGKRLLAHELTHVVQQSRGLTGGITRSGIDSPGDRYEIEADNMAASFVQGKENTRLPNQTMPKTNQNGTTSYTQRRTLNHAIPRAVQLFSGSAAASYARTWALSTNPAYGRMSNDCTNFASQSMLAGGWKMKRGWYRSNSVWWHTGNWLVPASWTWGGANNFYNFVRSSGRGTSVAHVMDLRVGDVLQMTFSGGHINHTMIVTRKTSSNLFLSYHTSDHLDRNFYGSGGIYDAYKTNPSVKYYGWNIV